MTGAAAHSCGRHAGRPEVAERPLGTSCPVGRRCPVTTPRRRRMGAGVKSEPPPPPTAARLGGPVQMVQRGEPLWPGGASLGGGSGYNSRLRRGGLRGPGLGAYAVQGQVRSAGGERCPADGNAAPDTAGNAALLCRRPLSDGDSLAHGSGCGTAGPRSRQPMELISPPAYIRYTSAASPRPGAPGDHRTSPARLGQISTGHRLLALADTLSLHRRSEAALMTGTRRRPI